MRKRSKITSFQGFESGLRRMAQFLLHPRWTPEGTQMAQVAATRRIEAPTPKPVGGRRGQRRPRVVETTLLELVQALGELTHDDREVVATVVELVREGKVRLTGSFRGQRSLAV